MNPRNLLLATGILFLAACDRGTAPDCPAGDSTCALVGGTNSGAVAGTNTGTNGNSGNNGNTGNNGNSGSNGSSGSNSGSGLVTTSSLIFDTGSAIVTLKKVDLAGRPIVQGGDKRQIAFFIDSDNSLHIVGSSDGEVQANYNRETIYDVYVVSKDSLFPTWLTTTDGGLGRSKVTQLHDASDPGNIKWALSFRFYTNARPLEAKIDGGIGSILLVKVIARSGIVSNTVLEDSLPLLKTSETKGLMKFGSKLTAIGSDPFLIVLP